MKPGIKSAAMVLALGLCFAARAGAQERATAEDFCASGDAKADKGDLDGAMADYNHAIGLDLKCAPAYCGRGMIKEDRGDDKGAIADYDVSIALDPTDPDAFENRAIARHYAGDLDGAIADFANALSLNRDSMAYAGLGAARQSKGDAEGAMADFDRAVDIDAKNPLPYMARGVEKFRLGKWADAAADLKKSCELPVDHDLAYYQEYAHVYLWAARVELGETDAATKELADYAARLKGDEPATWTDKVAGFLAGSATEADLMTAAGAAYKVPDPDQHCEAWFFAGMKKLAGGDKKGAAEDFHKCMETKRQGAMEYGMAESELKAMGE